MAAAGLHLADLKRNVVRLETIAELTARLDKLEAPRNGEDEIEVAALIG